MQVGNKGLARSDLGTGVDLSDIGWYHATVRGTRYLVCAICRCLIDWFYWCWCCYKSMYFFGDAAGTIANRSRLRQWHRPASSSILSWSLALCASRSLFSTSHFSGASLLCLSDSTRAYSLQMLSLQSDPCWGHAHWPYFILLGGSRLARRTHPIV